MQIPAAPPSHLTLIAVAGLIVVVLLVLLAVKRIPRDKLAKSIPGGFALAFGVILLISFLHSRFG